MTIMKDKIADLIADLVLTVSALSLLTGYVPPQVLCPSSVLYKFN